MCEMRCGMGCVRNGRYCRREGEKVQDIVWNWWCVDEVRSGSMRVSAARIVHFTPGMTKNKL